VTQQVVFTLSETRSGSTWLSYVLGTHPEGFHLGEFYRPFTMAGHTICRLCEAQGLDQCEILHGLEKLQPAQAFNQVFTRSGASLLSDCSKQIDWCERVLPTSSFDVRFIHLVRDPRGWFFSEQRREAMSLEQGLARWSSHFHTTQAYLQQTGQPHLLISYDELCLKPAQGLEKLSTFLGLRYGPEHYQTWSKPHHGLGGNGAAYNNLAEIAPDAVNSADPTFYAQRRGTVFYDQRWLQSALAPDLKGMTTDPRARAIMEASGFSMEQISEYLGGGEAS
jgi:hypothetical protein